MHWLDTCALSTFRFAAQLLGNAIPAFPMRVFSLMLLSALAFLTTSAMVNTAPPMTASLLARTSSGNKYANSRSLKSVKAADKNEGSADNEERAFDFVKAVQDVLKQLDAQGKQTQKMIQDVLKQLDAQGKQTQKMIEDVLKQWQAQAKKTQEFRDMIKDGMTPSKLYLEYGFNQMRLEQRYADPRFDYWAQFREFYFGWTR